MSTLFSFSFFGARTRTRMNLSFAFQIFTELIILSKFAILHYIINHLPFNIILSAPLKFPFTSNKDETITRDLPTYN